MLITENDFFEYAVKSYCNLRCLSTKEFLDDYARFKYVKRLLNRYVKTGILQERLILNHIISIYNVFNIDDANELLYFKCEKDTFPALTSFLSYLNYLPKDSCFECDEKITKILKEL